jgi:hypothetical protein
LAEIKEKSHGEQINELLSQADPMVDQLNNLYKMFSTGVERLPPTAKRAQLESIIARLAQIPKPNATYAFRVNALTLRVSAMKDKWDRMMRDIESGKIKPLIKRSGPR